MKPVQAVFFDLDDTLVDYTGSTRIALERTCLEFQRCAPGFDRQLAVSAYLKEGGRLWRQPGVVDLGDQAAYRTALWEAALLACGIRSPGLAREFAGFYSKVRSETMVAFDDAVPVLEALRPHFWLAVITNGNGRVQRDKLATAGLDGFFELVVASSEIGAAKPDAGIFAAALVGLGVEASGAWHVGDNLEADIEGAIRAGLSAAWLNRHSQPVAAGLMQPHVEITSLRDLLPLLGIQ